MKRAILTLILPTFFLTLQDDGKVTEEEFNKLILGRWKLTDLSINGYPFAGTGIVVHEFDAKKLTVKNETETFVNGIWLFDEKTQIMIMREDKIGRLRSYKMHYVTPDSLHYEFVTVSGLREETWTKIKP